MADKIKVGIVGGAGYTAGELLRILIHHPQVQIKFVYSTSQAGQPVAKTHTDLTGDTDLCFTGTLTPVDVIFLCLGHGVSREFLTKNEIAPTTKIIDLGNDFRNDPVFKMGDTCRNFIYGLPEAYQSKISKAHSIANPGCFATAIQLALLPLSFKGLLVNDVHVNAITGSTGAGRSLSETSHFSYRDSNISTYKVFSHQHLTEIKNTLAHVGQGSKAEINFVPVRGNFTRGIFATLYTQCNIDENDAVKLYEDFYNNHPYTHVSSNDISLKDVINTNKCLLNIKKYNDKLFITSCIDNLLKGASGQAVQNMNLMFGINETCGLGLKSTGF